VAKFPQGRQRSAVIASYALCGFANFGSIAILIGGVGGMAPTRRGDLARLGMRAILGGTLATCMAGCIASLLLP
jgi:CNT family concentrative nucleoside transporter